MQSYINRRKASLGNFSKEHLIRIIVLLEEELSNLESTKKVCSQCGQVDEDVRECSICEAQECQNDHRNMKMCDGCGEFFCDDHFDGQKCDDCEAENKSDSDSEEN